MENLRKTHNNVKRALIQSTVSPGMRVLDVGCGFGGDLQKWSSVDARVTMCDPIPESVEEARRRARNMGMNGIHILHGDILRCPAEMYDAVCYNFSLHYIFETRDIFVKSLNAIKDRLRVGGTLFGCIPDSDKILLRTPFRDSAGNTFTLDKRTGWGNFGERVWVKLTNTPFYKNGARPEPLAYRDLLITHLDEMGIELREWEPLDSPHDLSGFYSTFKFVRIR